MGYICLKRPNHPLADRGGRVFEHRYVLYEKVGPGQHPCHWCGVLLEWKHRRRAGSIVTDHIDFNRANNHPDNLVVSCNSCNTRRGRYNEVKDGEVFVERPGKFGGTVRSRAVERTCMGCEKPFLVTVSKLNHGRGHYCSRACQMLAARSARKTMTPGEKYIDRQCLGCGSIFQALRWTVEQGNGRYCSGSCRGRFARKVNAAARQNSFAT